MTEKTPETPTEAPKEAVKQQELQVHKTIVPMLCPHCSKEIMVASRSYLPIVEWVLRQEDLDKAKSTVIEEVQSSKLTDEEKKEVIEWLSKEDFSFGPAEMEMILERVLNKK